MYFNIDQWLTAILGSAQGTVSTADLLAAGGLIDPDYLDENIAFLMSEIDADFEEAERQDARKTPPESPASS